MPESGESPGTFTEPARRLQTYVPGPLPWFTAAQAEASVKTGPHPPRKPLRLGSRGGRRGALWPEAGRRGESGGQQ